MPLERSGTARSGSSSTRTSAANRALNAASEQFKTSRREEVLWWKQQDDVDDWSLFRRSVALFVFSRAFEWTMTVVILCNLLLIVWQTDQEAKCFPDYEDKVSECPTNGDNIFWLSKANLALVVFYTLEAVCKLTAARSRYFKQFENNLDCGICVMGILAEAIKGSVSVSWLRVFRLWRLVRVLNALGKVPEIHMLVEGLSGAIRAILFGSVLLLLALLFCAILIVQFIHPIAVTIDYGVCERCPRGFNSVGASMISMFQQIVAGDSWGQTNIPVIEKRPVVGQLLVVFQLMVATGIMNLILATVVDRAADAREKNKEKLLKEKMKKQLERKCELLSHIAEFDADGSGTLSREEIDQALQESVYLRDILSMSGVGQEDLRHILDALEAESGGEVKYFSFCELIHEIESVDLRKVAVVSHVSSTHRGKELQSTLDGHSEALARLERKIDNLAMLIEGRDKTTILPSACSPAPPSSLKGTCFDESMSKVSTAPDDTSHASPANGCNGWQSLTAAGIDGHHFSTSLETAEKLTREFVDQLKITDVSPEAQGKLEQDVNDTATQLGDLRRTSHHHEAVLLQKLGTCLKEKFALLETQCRMLDRACSFLQPDRRSPRENSRLSGDVPVILLL